MNWSGKQSGEGYEYHLLVIGISWALLLNGGGRLSMDRFFWGRPGHRLTLINKRWLS